MSRADLGGGQKGSPQRLKLWGTRLWRTLDTGGRGTDPRARAALAGSRGQSGPSPPSGPWDDGSETQACQHACLAHESAVALFFLAPSLGSATWCCPLGPCPLGCTHRGTSPKRLSLAGLVSSCLWALVPSHVVAPGAWREPVRGGLGAFRHI